MIALITGKTQGATTNRDHNVIEFLHNRALHRIPDQRQVDGVACAQQDDLFNYNGPQQQEQNNCCPLRLRSEEKLKEKSPTEEQVQCIVRWAIR